MNSDNEDKNGIMPATGVDSDAMMTEVRESLLTNLGQTIDAICKGTVQQMAKASRMSAENTLQWMVQRICQKTLERHPGDTQFVNEEADILVNSLFGQAGVSMKVMQCINEMKAEAARTRQEMDEKAHRRDVELRRAEAGQMHNVQNLFGADSVRGEGQMNVGGGTIKATSY